MYVSRSRDPIENSYDGLVLAHCQIFRARPLIVATLCDKNHFHFLKSSDTQRQHIMIVERHRQSHNQQGRLVSKFII
jgi:prephenate dehydratase